MWREIAIARDDATMRVRHRPGDGTRWVLLLHGACADGRTFEGQLPVFDDAVDVLVPDLRGHGASPLAPGSTVSFDAIVADVAALLAAVGSPRVTVVGHSYGSHVAQELAHLRPDLVERLVLIGCYDQHTTVSASERARVALTTAIVRVVPWRRFARFSANVATTDPRIRDELYETHLTAGRDVFLALGRTGTQAKHPVAAYGMPLLLVRGEREYSARLDAVYRRIAARSPHAQTVVIEEAGHLCHQERPDAVNRALTDFLAGTDGGRHSE